jgi:Zn-dependent peptidase ImmA (M78 family)
MSITWSRLAGDTSRFAVALSFQADPDGAAEPDIAATWGALQLWIDGMNITLHTVDGQEFDAVQWHLLPFLEWLAKNWNPLLHEERPPAAPQGDDAVDDLRATRFAPPTLDDREALQWEQNWYDWWHRHALSVAREGGLFPNVVLRRWRDSIEVSWNSEIVEGAPQDLQFAIPYGHARLWPHDVAEPLYEVAVEATRQLRERHPESSRIARLLKTLEKIDDRSLSSERLLWMADARPRGRAARQWRHVKRALDKALAQAREAALDIAGDGLVITGSCHAALLFGAVSPSLGNDDVATLSEVLINAYEPQGGSGRLGPYARSQPLGTTRGPVWEEGWNLAMEMLDALKPRGKWVNIEALLDQLDVPVKDVALEDQEIRGLSIAGEQHRWTICINPAYHDGDEDEIRRFTMAHELCHLLFDRGKEQKVAIASGPWAPRDVERRANAFAAMFLMPPDLVRSACRDSGALNTIDGIERVARTLHTSVTATVHQLANLHVIDTGIRDRLLARIQRH